MQATAELHRGRHRCAVIRRHGIKSRIESFPSAEETSLSAPEVSMQRYKVRQGPLGPPAYKAHHFESPATIVPPFAPLGLPLDSGSRNRKLAPGFRRIPCPGLRSP